MIEACGNSGQKMEIVKLFQDVKKELEPSVDTINTYFQAFSKARQPINIELNKKTMMEEEKKNKEGFNVMHEKLIMLMDKAVVELSTECKNPDCDRYLKEEEIMSSWSKSFDSYFIKCPTCGRDFIPTLDVQTSAEKTKSYYFLFPPLFRKEINNLIENKSLRVFFTVF